MISVEIAKKYLSAGLSVLPAVRAHKFPAVGKWKTWQERLPTEVEVGSWFSSKHDAVCIVCGEVSGNLEVIDFDNCGELFPKWKESIPGGLLEKLVIEQTPSGGFHVAYRVVSPVCGNIKLAQGKREDKLQILIETRGEGGLFLCDPSEEYTLLQNDFSEIPTITDEERENLLSAAYALNEHTPEAQSAPVPVGLSGDFAIRPGDDYNARGDFRSLIIAYGWIPLHKAGKNEYFRCPGKPLAVNPRVSTAKCSTPFPATRFRLSRAHTPRSTPTRSWSTMVTSQRPRMRC